MNTFSTIVSKSHIPYAEALAGSINELGFDQKLQVLVVDANDVQESANCRFHSLSELIQNTNLAPQIIEKYQDDQDKTRWSLKPVFSKYLLESEFEKVIFTDPDTFYFSDPSFLFEALSDSRFILTPHWRGKDPAKRTHDFYMQFTQVIYNGGFYGVNRSGKDILDWWAEACLFACEKSPCYGRFDDQGYMDLIPVYFEGVNILQHKGLNLASWNQLVCERTKSDGEVLINGAHRVVFIHFTNSTIRDISIGMDDLLKPHLEVYLSRLSEAGVSGDALVTKAMAKPSWLNWKWRAAKGRLKKQLVRWMN